MTRRLVLIRHAKAEQSAPDIGRPLNARGRRDAGAIGGWLVSHDVVPDVAVVSPSVRTLQTWELAATALAGEPALQVDPRVYTNTLDDLMAAISEQDEAATTVAMVGHNPSIHTLAVRLAGRSADLEDFPTATVAVLSVEGTWRDLETAALETVASCRA